MGKLQSNKWVLGGESSGHILCRDVASTGDGIVAALQVLLALQQQQMGLAIARAGMSKYPQHMINVVYTEGADFNSPAVAAAISHVEESLGGNGRVLVRASGTEPVVRVMVEGHESGMVQQLAEDLADIVKREVDK